MTASKQSSAWDQNGSTVMEDGRRSERRPIEGRGWISHDTGRIKTGEQNILIMNLSLDGVGFRMAEPLEVGAERWMIIAEPIQISSRIRVVSCRVRNDGWFNIGAEFY